VYGGIFDEVSCGGDGEPLDYSKILMLSFILILVQFIFDFIKISSKINLDLNFNRIFLSYILNILG
jgi:hypothetical protein